VPLAYHAEGFDTQVLRHFGIENAPAARPVALGHDRRARRQPEGEVTHRRRRQVHRS
jgi:CTP synthase